MNLNALNDFSLEKNRSWSGACDDALSMLMSAPMYLYYNLENKPTYYKMIFQGVNIVRRVISASPQKVRRLSATVIAAVVYWPLARLSKVLSKLGRNTSNLPLHHYADMPFVMLANDALDRFGTSLEQRFSKAEITEMLRNADFDLSTLKFSEIEPFWTFVVNKKNS